mmetsp:Transcript_91566/g.247427  ORF Transcript_91566/g.247427 Transcript_91566/m.247427 type:complete len:464 (-) Transcript_91566:36-1427(-)
MGALAPRPGCPRQPPSGWRRRRWSLPSSPLLPLLFCLGAGGAGADPAVGGLPGPYGVCGSESPAALAAASDSPALLDVAGSGLAAAGRWCRGRRVGGIGAAPNMTYRPLGRTGLRVSGLSFGTMTFNVQGGESREAAVARATEILRVAIAGGINFFDNAEGYGGGESEELFGQALASLFEAGVVRRTHLVITTKLFFGAAGINAKGLSRKKLVEGVQGSLSRMGLTYVDVLLCHRRDPTTPIEETVRAMNYILDKGWAFYWGTSEWPAMDIATAIEIARELKLVGPVVEQTKFNLFFRERVEIELKPLIERDGLGIMAFSPLAEGILAGRYTAADGPLPEGSRFESTYKASKGKVNLTNKFEAQVEVARRLTPIAETEFAASLAELSLAWALGKKAVSSVIIGATSVEQLRQNLLAPSLAPLPEEVARRMEAEAEVANVPLAWTVGHRERDISGAVKPRSPLP